jgi:hypothetical protein
VPFYLSNDIRLVAHIRQICIWLDFVNRRSAGAKFKWSVCLVNDPSSLIGNDSVVNAFSGEGERNHGSLNLARSCLGRYIIYSVK